MTENERWQATLEALERIAHDPNETAARRWKAEQALRNATRGSGRSGAVLQPGPALGNHRGGDFMRTNIEETG